MSDKLLPCPFCGGEAEYYGECDMVWVRCSRYGCYAEMPPVPLTVEQLRNRAESHDWIWVVNLNNGTGRWAAIDRITPPTSVEDEAIWWNVADDRHGDKTTLRDYGKTWLAYDRKPEGETK